MDPNANLTELRAIFSRIQGLLDAAETAGPDPDCINPSDVLEATEHALKDSEDDLRRAMDLFPALDEWLTNGGFLPEPWEREVPQPDKPELSLKDITVLTRSLLIAHGTGELTDHERNQALQHLRGMKK